MEEKWRLKLKRNSWPSELTKGGDGEHLITEGMQMMIQVKSEDSSQWSDW